MQNNLRDLSEGRDLPPIRVALANREEQPRHRGILPIRGSIYARTLSLSEVLPEDIIWLDKALREDYHEMTVEDILDGVVAQRYHLWRLGEKKGIAVTAIQTFPKGKDLCVAWLAGEEWVYRIDEFIADLENFARAFGCRWIPCIGKRKATQRLFSRRGKEVGVVFVREVEGVQ